MLVAGCSRGAVQQSNTALEQNVTVAAMYERMYTTWLMMQAASSSTQQ